MDNNEVMTSKVTLEGEIKEKPWIVFVDENGKLIRDFEVDSYDPAEVKIPDGDDVIKYEAIYAYFDTAWMLEFVYMGEVYSVCTGRKDPHDPKRYYMLAQVVDKHTCEVNGYADVLEMLQKHGYEEAILTPCGKFIEFVQPGEIISFMPGYE